MFSPNIIAETAREIEAQGIDPETAARYAEDLWVKGSRDDEGRPVVLDENREVIFRKATPLFETQP